MTFYTSSELSTDTPHFVMSRPSPPSLFLAFFICTFTVYFLYQKTMIGYDVRAISAFALLKEATVLLIIFSVCAGVGIAQR